MYRRRPSRPAPAPPRPLSAVDEILIADTFADLPFGGWAGEMATPSSEPPPRPPQPLVIPPADWEAEEREQRARENPPLLEETPAKYPPARREPER